MHQANGFDRPTRGGFGDDVFKLAARHRFECLVIDAGNFLVMHGPTVQHEIELWVAAGIPIEVALQAATNNSAKLLRADKRIGTIEKGKEASLLIVDGNPLQDVHALSAISMVFFKGERVNRPQLFEQN